MSGCSSNDAGATQAAGAQLKIRVCVIDDHPLIRNALVQLLSLEADMEICGEAATAESGFSQITALKPDVVLVDLSRSGSAGLELIKKVRSYDPAIGIMVLSMQSESFYGFRSLKAGANGYVLKQEAPFKVVDAIRQIRSGRLYASKELTAQVLSSGAQPEKPKSSAGLGRLNEREVEVVELIGDGNTTNEIAMRLHLSVRAIESHRAHIKRKLQLESSAQLVQFCVRWLQEKEAKAKAQGMAKTQ